MVMRHRILHRTLPNEKRIPQLFGDIQTTQFQWISDEEWVPVQSGDCEEAGELLIVMNTTNRKSIVFCCIFPHEESSVTTTHQVTVQQFIC
jgi:hypothetical protein